MKWGIFCLYERFNVNANQAIKNQLKLIELADAMRFDEIWVGEHHFNDFSICLLPSLRLAYLAGKTKYGRVGCTGFLVPFYVAPSMEEAVYKARPHCEATKERV